MNKKRKFTIENNEISEVTTVTLGGYSQKIMMDGKSKENPVVICLHGGPGTPIPFSVGCRGMFPDITDKVTLVCWDQLGCGINNQVIDDSFGVDNFVQMTVDLIKEIRSRFSENRIYLFGMSWGSVLSARAAAAVPELINGVVTYGQVLCDMTFNDEVYSALEASAMPESKKKKLQKMKKDRSIDNARSIMSWIKKYTEGYTCKAGKSAPIGGAVVGLMTSPDYTMKDFRAVVLNGYIKNTSLIKALTDTDLRGVLSNVKVPYTMLQGETDIVTSTSALSKFVPECGNPNLRLVVIPKSGHMPSEEAMVEVFECFNSL